MDDRLSYLVLTPDAEFVTDEIVRRHEARVIGPWGMLICLGWRLRRIWCPRI